MRHHFAVAGGHDLHARCSCGWTKHDPRWSALTATGPQVWEEAWPAFEAHVKADDPTAVCAYQVIGWFPTIPAADRNSRNRSDGLIFATRDKAHHYVADQRITLLRIEPVMLPAADPQIDFPLLDWEGQQARLAVIMG